MVLKPPCYVLLDYFKVAAYPSLRARIPVKFHLLVISTLKMNSVKFFDWATILKIDPFPYKGIMLYMGSGLYGVCK